MPETDADPLMPKRRPLAALRAIETIKRFRSWEPVEIYSAIREALQGPHEYSPEPGLLGSGEPPVQR